MPALDEFRSDLRTWLGANLRRRDPAADPKGASDLSPEEVAEGRRALRRLYDAGYVGITVPVEYGGRGLSDAHHRVWVEETADYDLPTPAGIASVVTTAVIMPTLLANATEEQKRAWVPRLLRGDDIWVLLLSEPGAGSDLAGILTRATRDGERWILNGSKVWSSGAVHADYGLCLARTDWDVPKHKGLTWFKVPLHDERVTVRPIRQINGSPEFCEEFLDDVEVGDDMVIGRVNEGWAVSNSMLVFERGVGHADAPRAAGAGAARVLPPDLVALAIQRGRTSDPVVRQVIARAHTEDWVHDLLNERISRDLMRGTAHPASASLAKLARGVRDPERALAALQIGGRATMAWRSDGSPNEHAALGTFYGRQMAIAGGSNQIQRNVISERLLGLPREPGDDRGKPFREVLRDAKAWGAS